MNIAELSFLTIFFFMVHEFEEIVCIKSWIQKNEKNNNLSEEMFIKGKKYYSSTETISLMILEEFVAASLILFIAINLSITEIAVGLFVVYTLHLFGHLFQALKFRKWTPGSRTTVATLPLIFIVFYIVFSEGNLNVARMLFWTIILLIILLLNLQLLHHTADKIERWRNT